MCAACPRATPPSWCRRNRTRVLLPVRQNTSQGRGKGRKGDERNLFRSPFLPTEWCGNSRTTHLLKQIRSDGILLPENHNVKVMYGHIKKRRRSTPTLSQGAEPALPKEKRTEDGEERGKGRKTTWTVSPICLEPRKELEETKEREEETRVGRDERKTTKTESHGKKERTAK